MINTFESTESDKKWSDPFFFIQGADTQFGMIESYIKQSPTPNWDEEKKLARLCVEKINSMEPKPRFFVICGDLTDAFPTPDGEEVKKAQDKDFIEIFSKLDKSVPLVCVCGNHDVGNTPTHETVQRYRSVYGMDYRSFWVGGVLFLVVNSQYWMDGSSVKDLVEEQEAWLDQALSSYSKSADTPHGPVVFQHVPPFLRKVSETDAGYFALPIEVRTQFLDKLHEAGVRHVFCGHYHRNAGGMYKDLEVVVTSAVGAQLGNDKSGFRIVTVTKDKISHAYYPLEQVPSHIPI